MRRLFVVIGAAASVACAGDSVAQTAAEFELERDPEATTSRLELARGGFYLLRAERQDTPNGETHRVGAKLPGSLVGLDGYASLFLEDDPASTGVGTNFELGKGLWVVGGSLERAEADFSGAYVKMRAGDLEISGGGGARDGRAVWHGAAYLKTERFSLATGGSLGPDESAYSHVAATWHPAPDARGRTPGAWMTLERDGPRDYALEIALAHDATFGHLTSWGAYGMDQWPHEKRIEALGDVMRYFRPSIRNHERSAGLGVLAAEWDVDGGEGTLTLDARYYPFRLLRASPSPPAPPRRDLLAELLNDAMVGWIEPMGDEAGTLLAELRLDPVVLYVGVPRSNRSDPYVFVQYVLRAP
jgi:hypothetical protein